MIPACLFIVYEQAMKRGRPDLLLASDHLRPVLAADRSGPAGSTSATPSAGGARRRP